MSKRVLLYAAAAFMVASSAGFVGTAMAAPRHAGVQFTRPADATSAVPHASRFMSYAGENFGPRPGLEVGGGYRSSNTATWQDNLASHG